MYQIQNFSKIPLLELLYAVVDAKQIKNPHKNWAIALGVTPRGPKYAQEPCKGSDLTQASEMGNSF